MNAAGDYATHLISRTAIVVCLSVLGVGLVIAVAVLTPWRPFSSSGPHVAVTWRGDFTPTERAHEQAYHRALRPVVYAGLLAGLFAAAMLALTPAGARLVSRAGDLLGGGWVSRAIVGGGAVALIIRAVAVPFDLLAERVLRRYGLSTQSWPSWVSDQLKGLGLGAVLLAGVLLAGYWATRHFPRTWWIWAAVGAAIVVAALSFFYPVVVEPVFNRFTPMPAGALRDSLLEMARADGVPVKKVLIADASRRTTAENAYVSGFGGTRRLVVYDTLLRESPEEVRLVVAHELGHAKRNDVLHFTLIGALSATVGVLVLALVLDWGWLLDRSGSRGAADPRSFALVLFVIAVLSLLTQPAANLISRRVEARADVHSLELTRDPTAFVQTERQLALSNLSDLKPSPLLYGLFATHPSTVERIALARDWALEHGMSPPGPLVAEAMK